MTGPWRSSHSKGKKEQTDYQYFAGARDGRRLRLPRRLVHLPRARRTPAALDWLSLVGSAEGQKAFNLAKGSIPARTDVPPTDFPPYQQSAMEAFKTNKIVSSIAHGAAVSLAWNADLNQAISKFYTTKDDATLVADLTAAAKKNLG